MQKIQTIYKRDLKTHKVIDELVYSNSYLTSVLLMDDSCVTEKLDGTNVRLTVRSKQLVRLEKRRNPSKEQKAQGIIQPWYVDVDPDDPADKYIVAAGQDTSLNWLDDGEYSGEAIGPKIQGNPLQLENNTVYLFSNKGVRDFLTLSSDPPFDLYKPNLERVKNWLTIQRSRLNPEVGIEGVVFWYKNIPYGKLKVKDFA